MKPKSLILLVVAGGCGLVAALAIMQRLQTSEPPQGPPPEPRKAVVVAVADLEAGTELKREMLKTREMLAKDLPDGSYTEISELTGQTLGLRVCKDDLVLHGKLAKGYQPPEGFKPITLKQTGDDGRVGFIKPGSTVDVYWTPSNAAVADNNRPKLLLIDARVCGIGGWLEGSETAPKDARGSDQYAILVRGDEVKRVLTARKQGRFELVLSDDQADRQIDPDEADQIDIVLGLKAAPDKVARASEPRSKKDQDRYQIE